MVEAKQYSGFPLVYLMLPLFLFLILILLIGSFN